MAPNQVSLHYSYNEFYFLTHPALFIEDHFPDNKNWQLLKPPQSLRQFENNMYHKSEFYNKGMLSAHPETPMIRTGKERQAHKGGSSVMTEAPFPLERAKKSRPPSLAISHGLSGHLLSLDIPWKPRQPGVTLEGQGLTPESQTWTSKDSS